MTRVEIENFSNLDFFLSANKWLRSKCLEKKNGLEHSESTKARMIFTYNTLLTFCRIWEMAKDPSVSYKLEFAHARYGSYASMTFETAPLICGLIMAWKAQGVDIELNTDGFDAYTPAVNVHAAPLIQKAVDEFGISHSYMTRCSAWSSHSEWLMTHCLRLLELLETQGLTSNIEEVYGGILLTEMA